MSSDTGRAPCRARTFSPSAGSIAPDVVRHLLPAGVAPDVLDGTTYVGLIPFRLVGTAVAGAPLPWGAFLETNGRLYSVDAAAVAVGRAVFGLPYRSAGMRFERTGAVRTYSARLRGPNPPVGSPVAVAPVCRPVDGPLERFLTARWGLHVGHLGRTWYLPNTHVAWPLRRAEVCELDGLLPAAGLGDIARRPPDHVAFSDGVAATFGRPVLTPSAPSGRPDNGTAPSG